MKRLFNRNRIFSTLLNLIGMTVALTTFMVIMVQVSWDWGFDNNYEGSDRIFRVEHKLASNDFSPWLSCRYINLFKNRTPEIEALGIYGNTPYYQYFSTDAESNEDSQREITISADADFLKVFPFEFIEGSAEGFGPEDRCIISESTAGRLFRNESPLGKQIYFRAGYGITVIGVYKDFPKNSCITNGVIFAIAESRLNNDSEWSSYAYFRLSQSASPDDAVEIFRNGALKALEEEIAALPGNPDSLRKEMPDKFRVTRVHDVYYQTNMPDSLPKGNRFTTDTIFAVSVLLMLVAIINFINFSMASVPLDIKSVNTRKVLGSSRVNLIAGQLAGSFFIVLVAYVLSILLLHVLSGTGLASYISGSLKPADNLSVLLIGLGVAIVTSVLAGFYPALYITSFQPALVLKGSFSLSLKGRALRNALIGFQYGISIILASMALYIWIQTKYMKEYDMGFKSDHVVVANVGSKIGNMSHAFKQKLMGNPAITGVTFSGGPLVSENKMGWGRIYNGERFNIEVLPVSTEFLDFFGIRIKEGRSFIPSDELSKTGSFIINETAAAAYSFMTVGNRIQGHKSEAEPAEIVGIAYDFNFKPMQYGIGPFALYQFGSEPWWPLSVAYVKISPSGVSGTLEYIRDAIREFNPDATAWNLELQFLDENIGNLYAKEEKLNRIIVIGALLSMFIALIGILGLVYFETQFSRKGIAVRKVFGATTGELLKDANRRYMIMAVVSFLVAVPVSYAIIKAWVRNFPYQVPFPVWIFAVTLAVILVLTVAVVTLRSYNAANSNPVDSIKNE